jgi:hypothetical protein
MTTSRRGNYIDYQARATAFHVGDRVYPILKGNPSNGGTVVAVWPAIGMVDVQYPHGATRAPVEDLLIDSGSSIDASVDMAYDSVPGGTHTVPVSGGPVRVARVLTAHLNKMALYWAAKGRQYRPSKTEIATRQLCCPRCEDAYLRKTLYKMEEGCRVKLFVCSECLFCVRRDDVLGFEE